MGKRRLGMGHGMLVLFFGCCVWLSLLCQNHPHHQPGHLCLALVWRCECVWLVGWFLGSGSPHHKTVDDDLISFLFFLLLLCFCCVSDTMKVFCVSAAAATAAAFMTGVVVVAAFWLPLLWF